MSDFDRLSIKMDEINQNKSIISDLDLKLIQLTDHLFGVYMCDQFSDDIIFNTLVRVCAAGTALNFYQKKQWQALEIHFARFQISPIIRSIRRADLYLDHLQERQVECYRQISIINKCLDIIGYRR